MSNKKKVVSRPEDITYSKDLFAPVNDDVALHDQAFETKPMSFLHDSLRRFAKSKASIVGAVFIAIITLYAIIVPLASPKARVDSIKYPKGLMDSNFSNALPYNAMFKGTGFWDGTEKLTKSESEYQTMLYDDSNHKRLLEVVSVSEKKVAATITRSYLVRVDGYAVGCKNVGIKGKDNLDKLAEYEKEQGIYRTDKSIVKPLVDVEGYLASYDIVMKNDGVVENTRKDIIDQMKTYYNQYSNVYFALSAKNSKGKYVNNIFFPIMENGTVKDIYQRDSSGNLVYSFYSGGVYNVRVDYFDYFTYDNGFEPYYFFGANSSGQDIFLRLAEGTRFSLLLGVSISAINFIIGLIWGALSGYYGGVVDLVMERVTDIVSAVPSIIILTICSIQFTNNTALSESLGTVGVAILAFLVAFVYSGWIGVASTTRMQFYRYKGQEYVLASRTLGAKDGRLIFKHILPNAVGTLVTSSVLMIPGVIFSESSLSYLGIINFTTSGLCSIGSLLTEGQTVGLTTYPHVLLFPCLIIALLMISFNLLGNGLRDAFNTSLKGADD